MRLTVTLPKPPSTNMLYANAGKRGRVKTPRYKAWITEAGVALNLQTAGATQMTGPVCISISLNKGRADLDNLLKPLIDLLVSHSVIEDDHNVVELSMQHDESAQAATVTVLQVETAKASGS